MASQILPKNACVTFLVVVLAPKFLTATVNTATEEFQFTLNQNGSLGLINPIQTRKDTTLNQCARECSSQADKCWAFVWDSFDGICTIGCCPGIDEGMRVNGTSRIFTRETKCRYDFGYQLRSYGTGIRCLFLSTDYVTHAVAEQNCFSHGGRLCKANDQELNKLLVEMTRGPAKSNGRRLFIGLDDLAVEGKYVWSDGTEMAAGEIRPLAGPLDFFNSGDRDCGMVNENNALLIIGQCNSFQAYACEMDF